jgi:hypothetical protein
MHGGNDVSDATVPAGGYVKIHHNTFMKLSDQDESVAIRGIPTEGVWIYRNWALHDPNIYTPGKIFLQSLGNLPGHTPYEKMFVYDNLYGPNPSKISLQLPDYSHFFEWFMSKSQAFLQ